MEKERPKNMSGTKSRKNTKKFTKYYTRAEVAKKYDKIRFETARGKFWYDLENEIIFNFCRGKNFLDLGCGTGRIAIEAKKRGFDVFALDISSAMLKQAKLKSPSIRYVKGNGEQMPFKNDAFDCVASFRILLHLKNHKKILSEVYRTLKEKGGFVFDVSNKLFYGRIVKIRSDSETYYFSRRKIEREASSAGFRTVKSVYFKSFLLASMLAQFKSMSKQFKKIEKIMSKSPFKVFSDSFIFYLEK
jgi:ubiquinone/menaquinone biosynthesis C-methylase UbiE